MMSASSPASPRPLRLWPAFAIVALQWLGRFGVPLIAPEALPYGVMVSVLGGLLIPLWWVFLSRAPWPERLGGAALLLAVPFGVAQIVHESIATGMMGMLFPIYAVPTVCLAFVLWAALSRRVEGGLRWAALVVALLLGSGGWALVRTGGFTTDMDSEFAWRWSPTAEDRLLAEGGSPAAGAPTRVAPAEPGAETGHDWPGFRGRNRDGIVRGVAIDTDWTRSPPVELWRRPVGPGWSSCAVGGGLAITQEQRGDDEVVAAYRLADGQPAWLHGDPVRFWESNAGAGPRGTPTLDGGQVIALGATGLLNVLDAASGAVVWSRDAAADTGAKLPIWGFSGSPLVLDDRIVVAASGALVAYDRATGEVRWVGPAGGEGYSSPQLLRLGGVPQVLQLHGEGLIGVDPADGTLLWEHAWSGYPIVQPAQTADGDVLISVNADSGTRRVAVEHGPEGWSTEERWTSSGLKSYFNDFVVHRGQAYGFDGTVLACIDVADGARRWKGGRYGGGQLLLLADQDLLLVLSERGELALVPATPDGFTELARFPALTGRTWNHLALAGDTLLVRNDEELAAFRLTLTPTR